MRKAPTPRAGPHIESLDSTVERLGTTADQRQMGISHTVANARPRHGAISRRICRSSICPGRSVTRNPFQATRAWPQLGLEANAIGINNDGGAVRARRGCNRLPWRPPVERDANPTVTQFVVEAMTNGAATVRLEHEGGPWTL